MTVSQQELIDEIECDMQRIQEEVSDILEQINVARRRIRELRSEYASLRKQKVAVMKRFI